MPAYQIISSTDGKIEHVFCRSKSAGSTELLNLYIGVRAAFGKSTVIGISDKLDLHPVTIHNTNKNNPQLRLPSTPEEQLLAFIGKRNYEAFQKKHSKNKIFEQLFNSKKNTSKIDYESIFIQQLENEISNLAEKFIKAEIQKLYSALPHKFSVLIDVNLKPDPITPLLMGWVQDIFVATKNISSPTARRWTS